MFDTQVTVVGNLVADPRVSYTKDGQPIASFRLASTPRRFDRTSGQWKDGDTLFTSVTCWRALAENVHLSLRKGNSVIVIGRLSVRPYETKDGDKRQSVDIDAMAVGPELGRATTIIKRVERSGQPSAGAEFATPGADADDLALSAEGIDREDGAEGDLVAPGGIDWGVSLGEPFGDGLGDVVGVDVPEMDGDGIGQASELLPAMDPAESDLAGEPVAQLASTGGRWRSRSAG
ncbi:MAG TPA: single-stranded DNA-binding protein [Acidothermaceae bacterium]